MKRIWPFTFYFFYFAGVAFMMPFLVLFYQSLNFDGAQIGLLAGLSPLVTLFAAPLWTGLADATRRHRPVMALTMLAGSLAVFALPFLTSFAPVLLAGFLFSAFFSPVSSFADNATMALLAGEKDMYGRLRLGGTIGFALAAPVAGLLVQAYGLKAAFWGCAAMYVIAFLASRQFVRDSARGQAPVGAGARALLANPRWLLFLLGAFAGGLTLAFSNSYFFPYLKELGTDETTMGLALTMGTVCEVPVLFFGHHLLRRLGAYRLFIASLLMTGGRMLLFAGAGTPGQALLIQLLGGFTFPAMWIAGVAYADENAPAGMSATAQGIFSATVFGVGTAVGGFAGGPLLSSAGARGMSLIYGVILLAIVGGVVLAGSRLRPGTAEP